MCAYTNLYVQVNASEGPEPGMVLVVGALRKGKYDLNQIDKKQEKISLIRRGLKILLQL
jgi:hypothetical protein